MQFQVCLLTVIHYTVAQTRHVNQTGSTSESEELKSAESSKSIYQYQYPSVPEHDTNSDTAEGKYNYLKSNSFFYTLIYYARLSLSQNFRYLTNTIYANFLQFNITYCFEVFLLILAIYYANTSMFLLIFL